MNADVRCARMSAATMPQAFALLASFLEEDQHYRASSAVYGDGGTAALRAALDLFVAHPEHGFVWLAFGASDEPAVGACVVCYAISTSRGTLVAKLDDVTIAAEATGQGIGTVMLRALFAELAREGVTRVDSACHRDNMGAWRFYARLGFQPLHEERIALLIA